MTIMIESINVFSLGILFNVFTNKIVAKGMAKIRYLAKNIGLKIPIMNKSKMDANPTKKQYSFIFEISSFLS